MKKVFLGIIILGLVGLSMINSNFSFKSKEKILDTCKTLSDNNQKIDCWKKQIDAYLSKGDLDKSMDLVAQFYQTDPVFAANCHDFTHSIGKKAYQLFAVGDTFKVGDKTSYCAYGFYHGFMENLVAEKGDPALARDFCKIVDQEVSKTSPGVRLACYHGIGHGWTNVHDKKFYGNERAMVNPAISLCEKVTQDPEELKICVTGVFDSISIGYYNEAYGLKVNKKDPYWLCDEQKEKYKTPCYMDLTPAVVWLGNYRLAESLKYLSTVEPKYRDLVVSTISEDVVRFIIRDGQSIEKNIEVCKSLDGVWSGLCIQGLSAGYLQFGAPGQEEKIALDFCKLDVLNSSDKNLCYSKLLANAKGIFSKDRYKNICLSVPDDFKNGCANN